MKGYHWATKPLAGLRLEVAVVEVHGGAMGVLGMHHRGQAASEERDLLTGFQLSACAVGPPLGGRIQRRLGHLAVDNAEVHPSLLLGSRVTISQ